jgi:hypothetical protein
VLGATLLSNKIRSIKNRISYTAKIHGSKKVVGFKNQSIEPSKRALLAYLPEHVSRYLNGEKIIRFSNNGIAIS